MRELLPSHCQRLRSFLPPFLSSSYSHRHRERERERERDGAFYEDGISASDSASSPLSLILFFFNLLSSVFSLQVHPHHTTPFTFIFLKFPHFSIDLLPFHSFSSNEGYPLAIFFLRFTLHLPLPSSSSHSCT